MRISDKQIELLERGKEEGAIDYEIGSEIYRYIRNFYHAIEKLENLKFVERKEAPEDSNKKYLWFLTPKGKGIIK